MATCAWCKTTSKKMIVDSEGVCAACRNAARYPSHPTNEGYLIGEDRSGYMPSGGRKTRAVWGYDNSEMREDE